MAEPQHFCLRWNNYQSSITSAFENLRDDEDFVDVTLACDGRSIKAHRVVLSACSPYFRELLKSTSCKHPVIVLQDVSFLDLHALVEFIYHGEVNVHQNSLSSFLKTAEILRVSGLTQQQAAETNSQLAHIQNLAAQNSTGSGSSSSHRTSLLNHQAFSDRSSVHDDSLYPRGGSSTSPTPPPPPHFSNLPLHQQHLQRRPTVYRRDRNNSSISDDFSAIKRHRPDNGPLLNNPSPDPNSVSPQVTPADFSTIKHNNNNTPPLKDEKRNGPNGNIEKELSPTPSQEGGSPAEGDVKSEPMELVCSNNNPNDNNSNDSCNIGDNENNTGRDNPTNSGDIKGSLSSANDDEHENSVQHPAGNFLISPDSKLFPGSFNFMNTLHDHPALNFNLQSPNDITSQGGGTNILGGVIVPGGNNNSSNNNQFHLNPHQIHHHLLHSPPNQHHHPQTQPQPPPTHYHLDTSPLHHHHSIHHRRRSLSPSMTSGVSSVTASNNPASSPASSGSNVQRGDRDRDRDRDRDIVVGPGVGGVGGGGGGSSRLLLPLPLSACHRCDVCGKLLSTKLTLKRHKEQQHLQPLNNAVCNLCHKVFRTLNSLNNHKSIYHRRQKNHHHHSYYHHTNSLHHSLGLSGGSGSSPVVPGVGSSAGSGPGSAGGRLGISELLSPQHHDQSGQGIVKPCIDFL